MKKQFLCRNTEACKYPLVGYMSMRVRVAVLKVVIVILLLVLCVEFVFYLFVVPATSFAKVE
ncbi:cell division protein FtsQ/DivIB, partial [Treponema pallidum]